MPGAGNAGVGECNYNEPEDELSKEVEKTESVDAEGPAGTALFDLFAVEHNFFLIISLQDLV